MQQATLVLVKKTFVRDFLRCEMRYSSSFLRFGNRPNDFRTLLLSVIKLRFLKWGSTRNVGRRTAFT